MRGARWWAGALLFAVLACGSTVAASSIPTWDDRGRGSGYPGTCTEPVTIESPNRIERVQYCFGAYGETAQGETVFLSGTGFARGTNVTIQVLDPRGALLIEGSESLGENNVPGELLSYIQPELDWRVPRDAEPGEYVARILWEGRTIEHRFLVHAAPRIFVGFAGPPARGSVTMLEGVGFEDGPFSVDVVQGPLRWTAYATVIGGRPGELTRVAIEDVTVPGVSTPRRALDVWGHYDIEVRLVAAAGPEEEIFVWMNGTRGGAPASDAVRFTPREGPRAWIETGAIPGLPTPTMPTPTSLGCGARYDAMVFLFAADVATPGLVRILSSNGTELARVGAPAGEFVGVDVPLRQFPGGSYVAQIDGEEVPFMLGPRDHAWRCGPPPTRPTPDAGAAGVLVVCLAASIALRGRAVKRAR